MVRVHIGHMEMFFLTVDEAAGTELFIKKHLRLRPRPPALRSPRLREPGHSMSHMSYMTLTLTDGPRSRLIAVHLHVRDRKLVFMIPCVM